MIAIKKLGFLSLLLLAANCFAQKGTPLTDHLVFGSDASEKAHAFTSNKSQIIAGLLNEPARILLPIDTGNWQGGSVKFTVKVDPVNQNYITVRLSGNDVTQNLLNLICEGKQVGYRHLGDIELFDLSTDAPFKNGCFYYKTSPLPFNLTQGKQTVQLEIRSSGRIWGYGSTFERYQYPMTEPTRGIYNIYIHSNSSFVPNPSEKQGRMPAPQKAPPEAGDFIAQVKAKIDTTIAGLLRQPKPLSQVQMQFLAKAWHIQWTSAFHNKLVEDKILAGLDSIYVAYMHNPALAQEDPATWNPDWFGLGITGQVIWLLNKPLDTKLQQQITYPGLQSITRKEAYAQMLVACRDWHAMHRRMYTNQSMINDLYGIYYANKGLQQLNAAKAAPEKDVLRYLYESMGMQPWLGSDDASGKPTRSAGNNYWQLTAKALTKELGYVGNYGEVLDWIAEIYDATRPAPGLPGDLKIKEQVEKMALARMIFRYPATDADGFSVMRLQVIVGWRDTHYPGDITYLQRPSWDGNPFQVAVATEHPALLAFARQQLEDNQFFKNYKSNIDSKNFRVIAALLTVPGDYEKVLNSAKQNIQMPMAKRQPDFVFSDEEDGVVAVKNGDEYFYASLYWRARHGINKLGRVHLIQPGFDRIATVYEHQEFEPNGNYYTIPNYTNFGFGNGGPRYPDTTRSAHEGLVLPVAKIPADANYKNGQEHPAAGRASIYKLQYDRYLVLMNNSKKEYTLKIPALFKNAANLSDRKKRITTNSLIIKPGTTLVLYK
ncbi:hypothetical protein [Filimonas effusa]|uniref:Uncharacterized protein n=1 Tax=Filimonas effusa TaxID=2508721 RepID=A0A4Q1DD91_9BACT|nr:hypothetical protein [Filimonas effusa]RXK86835.1 hypothetical protein ESB13_08575 [Filimonas effusa]